MFKLLLKFFCKIFKEEKVKKDKELFEVGFKFFFVFKMLCKVVKKDDIVVKKVCKEELLKKDNMLVDNIIKYLVFFNKEK